MEIDLDLAFVELTISGKTILVKWSHQNWKKNSMVIRATEEKTKELWICITTMGDLIWRSQKKPLCIGVIFLVSPMGFTAETNIADCHHMVPAPAPITWCLLALAQTSIYHTYIQTVLSTFAVKWIFTERSHLLHLFPLYFISFLISCFLICLGSYWILVLPLRNSI